MIGSLTRLLVIALMTTAVQAAESTGDRGNWNAVSPKSVGERQMKTYRSMGPRPVNLHGPGAHATVKTFLPIAAARTTSKSADRLRSANSSRSTQWQPYRSTPTRWARAASQSGVRLAQDTSGQSDPFEDLFDDAAQGTKDTDEGADVDAPTPRADESPDRSLEEIAPSVTADPPSDSSPADSLPNADLSVSPDRQPAYLKDESTDELMPEQEQRDEVPDPFEDDSYNDQMPDDQMPDDQMFDERLPLDPSFDGGPSFDGLLTGTASADCLKEINKLRQDTIDKIVLSIGIEGRPGQDFPYECSLSSDQFVPRQWAQTIYTWKASGLCHKPLYFEDGRLERYGHSWGPYVQPFVSGAHFFTTLPILPYKMGLKAPTECVYALGHYRPGSCAPYTIDPIPFTWRAALFETGAVVGTVLLVP